MDGWMVPKPWLFLLGLGLAGVQTSSSKQQAASKHQASSSKHQAASIKHQPSKSSICFVTNQHATENKALLTRQHFLTG
jgi:hypothetical protein